MPHNHVTLRIAGRKGGLVPNPKSQRNAARLAAIENQPWQHSTGPMSGVGKAVSSLNALKRGPLTMHIVIRSWEVEDYWAECARAESALAALHGIGELWPFVNQFGCLSLNLDLGRQQRSNTAGNRWSLFSARLRRPKLDLQWCSKCGMPFDEYKALKAAADQRYCQAIALVREIIAAGNSGQLPEVIVLPQPIALPSISAARFDMHAAQKRTSVPAIPGHGLELGLPPAKNRGRCGA